MPCRVCYVVYHFIFMWAYRTSLTLGSSQNDPNSCCTQYEAMDMTMPSVPGRQIEAMAGPVHMKRMQGMDREATGATLLHNRDESSSLKKRDWSVIGPRFLPKDYGFRPF